jgi:hypothetical protein
MLCDPKVQLESWIRYSVDPDCILGQLESWIHYSVDPNCILGQLESWICYSVDPVCVLGQLPDFNGQLLVGSGNSQGTEILPAPTWC